MKGLAALALLLGFGASGCTAVALQSSDNGDRLARIDSACQASGLFQRADGMATDFVPLGVLPAIAGNLDVVQACAHPLRFAAKPGIVARIAQAGKTATVQK